MLNPCSALALSGALLCAMPPAAAQAPPSTPDAGPDGVPAMVVRVTGVRAAPWKTYRAMRAGLSAFASFRDTFAPEAVFRFAVLPPAGQKLPPNFQLRVRTREGLEVPVVLENGEQFQLPILPDLEGDADLVSNLKGGQLRIGLLVHTPSVPLEKMRLGDVRLRCEVAEAIANVDAPLEDQYDRRTKKLRPRYRCGGRLQTWHKPLAPASSASVTDGVRRIPLRSMRSSWQLMFLMPTRGDGWDHNAIIEFEYEKPPGPLKLSQLAVYQDGG